MAHTTNEDLANMWLARFGSNWISYQRPADILRDSELGDFWEEIYVRLNQADYFEKNPKLGFKIRVDR